MKKWHLIYFRYFSSSLQVDDENQIVGTFRMIEFFLICNFLAFCIPQYKKVVFILGSGAALKSVT